MCVPAASVEICSVALAPPEDGLSEPAPIGSPSAVKLTRPVAAPEPGATAPTFAVIVTSWSSEDGEGPRVR